LTLQEIAAQSERKAALLRADAPDHVADVIGDEQRAALVDGDADRAAHGVAVLVDEAAEHFHRHAVRLAVAEGHEDDVVAAERLAVPRAVLADEGALAERK